MKIIKYISLIATPILTAFVFRNHLEKIKDDVLTDMVTFLSITIGFGITALSIISASKFSQNLYRMEDSNNNSRTLLHVIVGNFERAVICFTLNIALIFLYKFLNNFCGFKNILLLNLSLRNMMIVIIWYFLILSFLLFIYLLITFCKYVIKSAATQ